MQYIGACEEILDAIGGEGGTMLRNKIAQPIQVLGANAGVTRFKSKGAAIVNS